MTDSPNPVIIEKIEPRTWALHVRDTRTDEVHELELRGHGPWKIDVDGKATALTGKAQKQVAPPPDDAITLRLERAAGNVRIGAVGRGAKVWTAAQGTLLGSKWFLDSMGAPVVVLEDRPTLVDELRAALPSVALDLAKYTADAGADVSEGPVPAKASAPAVGPKKGGRGFGGKVDLPPDEDIQLVLSNAGRTDDMVSVTATNLREGVNPEAVRAWVERRAAPLGSWQPLDGAQVVLVRDHRTLPEDLHKALPQVRLDVRLYFRPGVPHSGASAKIAPEDMKYPEVIASLDRQDPRAITILHDIIRQISEVFIVVPLVSGHGYRSVELLTDRPTGIYDGLPIGTPLLQVRLRHDADPTISATDWAPLRKTLRALGRPEKQLQILREYVSDVLVKASRAAREQKDPDSSEAAARPDPAAPNAAPRGRKKAKLEPGAGPGGLNWEPVSDRGTEGLAARWGEGQFKLLHVGGDNYGLFYERDGGGFETLACGSLEDGKAAAGERVAGAREPVPLDARLAQVACATERKTGRPTNKEITFRVRRSENARAIVVIQASGDRVFEWALLNKSVLGGEWSRGEDGLPEARKHDSPTLIDELRKEFPGVNIDTSSYKKLRRAAKSEPETADSESPPAAEAPVEPVAPAEPVAPTEEETPAQPPPQAPPSNEADQDAELMALIKGKLAEMLDEED